MHTRRADSELRSHLVRLAHELRRVSAVPPQATCSCGPAVRRGARGGREGPLAAVLRGQRASTPSR